MFLYCSLKGYENKLNKVKYCYRHLADISSSSSLLFNDLLKDIPSVKYCIKMLKDVWELSLFNEQLTKTDSKLI
jgi:hypothetical protein